MAKYEEYNLDYILEKLKVLRIQRTLTLFFKIKKQFNINSYSDVQKLLLEQFENYTSVENDELLSTYYSYGENKDFLNFMFNVFDLKTINIFNSMKENSIHEKA